MPKKVNSDGPQRPDPTPNAAGASPAVRILETKPWLVMRQLEETEDARVVARRHGVKVSDVVRVVARELRAMRKAA
jgi:plasmid stabilization system protein ParE